jgi:hypothetical protein
MAGKREIRFLRTFARVLSVLAFLIIAYTVVWSAVTLGDEWFSDFRVVNDLTPTQPGTTEVGGHSTQTVEPEDFIGIAVVATLAGLGVAGVTATWRSQPGLVLVVALAVLLLALISIWSIGLIVAPAGLLLLLGGVLLFASKAGARGSRSGAVRDRAGQPTA